MKTKFMSLIIVVFLINTGYGQDYVPLVRENAHWVVASNNDEPWQWENFREYYTADDTLINDTLYKKVYRYQLQPSDSLYMPPYTRIGNPVLYSLIREDTIGRIVYGIQLNIDPGNCFYTEDTLFDFSVSQNDTLELCQAFMGPIPIDTIFYGDAFGYNRRILIMGGNYPFYFIEGIGSNCGLFEYIGVTCKDINYEELICYTLDDISNCDILTHTDVEIIPDIKIFPNPLVGDHLYIQIPGNAYQKLTVQISDIFGEIIYKDKLDSGKLNLGSLNQGVYIIKVIKENKLLLIKKILKI
ncbi:MAG: T9SS type A sorting domain-containing protein [Bacteroidetes bacterium]|nr:T9SS type A sorting domain-containing protein [Bacteroidota bacterium]MBL7102930.1 T9SS type A sorting domain-containing protein [Bacteroidales bacterium]